jgi:class 3 adenylate cyclase/tetratricopeptide (TPR) repeat protein
MRCLACEADNPATGKFCGNCGASLAVACAGCGQRNPPANRFCSECGSQLAGAGPPPPAVSPQTYTPRHLAERILISRSALEGERKQVTVLFADIKGSTELIQALDPEEARTLLDGAVRAMMDGVHRYEGTVNQILGDGIMALFGAPLAHEDHALRACYAALAIQAAIARYAGQARREHGLDVQVRIGLNSGEVVVRAIATDLRMDYSAIGHTTHLAARMEQLARDGSILLTAQTLALAEGYIQVRSLGPARVKGLAEPVEVFELVGPAATRTRLQAAAARGLTPFVGRVAELEAIYRALEQARRGHGQVLALVGEPGVGKSRLVWEVTHSHRTQGWLVLESSSVSYGRASSYLPLIELLKAYCRIEARDDERTVREKVTGRLLTLDESLRSALPALLALLEVPVEDPNWQLLDPSQRRRQTLEACRRLLLRESQVQPLLLVFEDLHWVDAETQALLDSLVESLPTARVLLLVNYRPEYAHSWSNKTYYCQLRVDPLPADSAEDLLQALLGAASALEPLKRLLIERTEGNPFFLEESVRTLVEIHALVGERGAYQLAKALPSIQVPATVQAVLAARIDRLPPEDKRLLESAAVIGKDIPFALLQAIAESPEDELRRYLARLQVAEFLYEMSLFPELEYTFRHALTHEVAYRSLLQERRRALHARIVEVIEQLASDRLAEHVERLAHHALQGEVWDKAVRYLRQAGLKAVARSAHRKAVEYFDQALGALAHLPETRETLALAIDLRLDLRTALFPLVEIARIFEYLREAETLAEALGDDRRLSRVSAFMTNCLWLLGEHDRAIEAGQRSLATAEALSDIPLQVLANFYLALTYWARGDHRRAIDSHRRVVAAIEADRMGERFGTAGCPAVLSRGYLAWCLAELGEFAEGTALGQQAVRIGETLDHPYSLTVACIQLGGLYLRRGHVRQAIATLERGLDLCRTWDIPQLFPWAASRLGAAYALAGRVADGLRLLQTAVAQAESGGTLIEGPLWTIWLSEAHLLAGQMTDALQLASSAVDRCAARHERGYQAWGLRLLGEIAARSDPPQVDQAETAYRGASALAEELGMRPLLAHCHLGLSTVCQRSGNLARAGAERSTAVALLREMEMTFWLAGAGADGELTHATTGQ